MPKKIKRLSNKLCCLPFAVTGGLLFGDGGRVGGGGSAGGMSGKNENTS